MIEVNILKAPESQYLGTRTINRNQITIGPKEMLVIDTNFYHFDAPITISIVDNKLVFSIEGSESHLLHNGNKSRLPFVTQINDIIEFDGFQIQIKNFYIDKYTNYRNFIAQSLEESQKKPVLLNLINKLTQLIE